MLLNGPVVLFFYPAAMTKGCTKESCHFRDLASEFSTLGGQRLGISMDTVAKQSEFTHEERSGLSRFSPTSTATSPRVTA